MVVAGVAACSDDDDAASVESDVRANVTEVSNALSERATDVSNAISEGATVVSNAVQEGANDAAEAVARNIAARQGAQQFSDAGYPLDGELDCTATVADGVDNVDIECTGTTEDGGAAELTGTTNEVPGASVTELDGDFTGTVDGTEVFTTQTLGG